MTTQKYITERPLRIFRCAFAIGDRQCTAAGTGSLANCHGRDYDPDNIDWFCGTHLENRRHDAQGLALMDVVDTEWRRRMADRRTPGEKMIDDWLAGHPELKKTPQDDHWSHLFRCMDAMPKGFHGQRERLEAIAARAERDYRAIEKEMEERLPWESDELI